MKYVVHKQSFGPCCLLELTIPVGSKILDIQIQNDLLTFWYERPAISEDYETHVFHIYPTGQSFNRDNERLDHVKTVHSPEGLVWHLYKKIP